MMYFVFVLQVFPKSCVKVELLTSKIRAHMKMKNCQNVTGEMLLPCRVLWAGTMGALSMQLPCVVTDQKS